MTVRGCSILKDSGCTSMKVSEWFKRKVYVLNAITVSECTTM